jgi:hypothetical protein
MISRALVIILEFRVFLGLSHFFSENFEGFVLLAQIHKRPQGGFLWFFRAAFRVRSAGAHDEVLLVGTTDNASVMRAELNPDFNLHKET